jgi:hypothetical protein
MACCCSNLLTWRVERTDKQIAMRERKEEINTYKRERERGK